MIKKISISKLLEITYFCFLIFIAILAVVNLSSRIPSKKSFQILSVVSGSMKPQISVGSAIVVNKATDYFVNDIISFKQENKIITHRIIYAGKYYLTKGDANNVIDKFEINKSQILGKVVFIIPVVGYIQESSKTIWGLIGFIYFPALLIIIVESRLIIKEFGKLRSGRINIRPLAIVIFGIFLAVDNTYAFYSTKQLAFNAQINTVATSPSPTPTSTASPTASPSTSPTATPLTSPLPTPIGNTGNGSGSSNTVIINNSSNTTVTQTNTSTQTNTVTNNTNTGNNSGQNINTATSSATTTSNNQSNTNNVVIH
jgi:signal peptidase